MSQSLGTARWATDDEIYQLRSNQSHAGKDAELMLGAAIVNIKYGTFDTRREAYVIAGRTDQHALICMGPRGGKGTSIIVPNLVTWRGSCVVIDPKGENATITARRRGKGSPYANGMGQKVYTLDPFEVAQVDADMRARFNPLHELDPHSDEAVDAAGQIADAIVVAEEGQEPHWNESARYLIKGLILYVLTAPEFEGARNLISVRYLLVRGDWLGVEAVRRENHARRGRGDDLLDSPDPFGMLWLGMSESDAFEGIVSGVGTSINNMADKERDSVLSTAKRQTEFIESPAMRRSLETSDFSLSDLKTDPQGISIYLSLPTRYMGTHYRWLRMFVTLMLDEMERIAHQPKCGYPVLMVLDEFPGLRRMRRIEDATAQIPGYGVKLLFVVQSLTQLKDLYKDNWETFVTSSGIRVFAANEDPFTLQYISRRLGQLEILRTMSGTSSGGGLFGTSSTSEQIHKRSLLTEDEIALTFSFNAKFSLAMVSGLYPMKLQRFNYYKDFLFDGMYDPHPDHPAPKTLQERAAEKGLTMMTQANEATKTTTEEGSLADIWNKFRAKSFGDRLIILAIGYFAIMALGAGAIKILHFVGVK